jgi:hypothetical protein
MLQLSDLIVPVLLALAVFCWWHDQGMRQFVLDACFRYCHEHQVQLLDHSVALHRLWFRRDEWGRLKFWRLYQFEFASSENARYKGRAITLGKRVLNISLEPYPSGPQTKTHYDR